MSRSGHIVTVVADFLDSIFFENVSITYYITVSLY